MKNKIIAFVLMLTLCLGLIASCGKMTDISFESDALSEPIKNLLAISDIEYKTVNGNDEGYQSIINEIKGVLGI